MPEEDSNPEGIRVSEVLKDAFPGRDEETLFPIRTLYMGFRWPRDFRDTALPLDEKGNLAVAEDEVDTYIGWLAEYLPTISLPPARLQEQLIEYALEMEPTDSMFFLGMHAGIYAAELRVGELSDRLCTENLASELEEKERNWGNAPLCPVDAGYRVVLGKVLQRVSSHHERCELLDKFYELFHEYASK